MSLPEVIDKKQDNCAHFGVGYSAIYNEDNGDGNLIYFIRTQFITHERNYKQAMKQLLKSLILQDNKGTVDDIKQLVKTGSLILERAPEDFMEDDPNDTLVFEYGTRIRYQSQKPSPLGESNIIESEDVLWNQVPSIPLKEPCNPGIVSRLLLWLKEML